MHPSDRVRMVRALEVQELERVPISARHDSHGFRDRPFDMLWLAPDVERERLNQRLRERVDSMFDTGLVEEVRSLHAAGYGPAMKPLQAIGYREVGQLLAGELSEPDAREATSVATRRYAKRQRTWFRTEPGLEWLQREPLLKRARAFLQGEEG